MQLICQRDPKWSSVKLGSSGMTVGNYGCTISCVSMSSSWAGCFKDPLFLARHLSFTSAGLLIWSSIASVLCLKFVWRGYTYDQKKIDEALKGATTTCLLNVDYKKHWVLGIYRVPFTNKYWVADPWDGKRKFYSGVVGYAILQKK